ncbi:MAG: cold-shock protein [Bacillota bacterium]|nr:MAG: cold-shock protein [Bacillota bacterium]
MGVIGQAGGQDLWVFAESLAEPELPLVAGERVSYYVVFGPWGPEATRVRRAAG